MRNILCGQLSLPAAIEKLTTEFAARASRVPVFFADALLSTGDFPEAASPDRGGARTVLPSRGASSAPTVLPDQSAAREALGDALPLASVETAATSLGSA